MKHVSQVINRVRTAWADTDHAQRRRFEMRTGRELDRRGKRSQDELEALYAVPPAKRPLDT